MTFWPSEAELQELDLAVMELEMLEREKPPTPFWKAYELVNRRLPGIGLISGVNALVNRASQRLKEAESDLERLRRKASDDVPEAKRLLKGLQAIYKDASNASTFQWEDYEGLFDGNKPFRLPYGDSAPRGVRCYMRALQLIVDDLHYRQLLFQARPLLKWIVNRGNPDYIRRPEWGCLPLLYEYWTAQQSRETKSRKRELARIRKQKQWARENRSKKPKAPKKHAKNARPILGAATRQRRISDRSAVAKFA
ncbi:MAG TPA: hypothetical protein VFU09_08990 [Candidatus Udaeobacter sp.]|nr:hypothetical protein [Candidatus Udaeobacter sp.]